MIFKKYTSRAYATRLLILGFDIFLAFVSILFAGLLRHNFSFEDTYSIFSLQVVLVVAVRAIAFWWFRTYAVIVRFAGTSDIEQIFYTVTGGTIFLLSLSIFFRPYGFVISNSVLLIDYFLLVTTLAATRFMMPLVFRLVYSESKKKINIVIFGAGQLGAITRKVIKEDPDSNYDIKGIIDDNKDIHSKFLDGIRVYKPSSLNSLVDKENISTVIMAIKNISAKRKNELVDLCLENELKILQVPFSSKWVEQDFRIAQIREIEIEDLLNRSAIVLSEQKVNDQFSGKKILITGGAGSIGSEIVRQLLQFKPEAIIIVDQAETPLVNLGLEIKEEYEYEGAIPIVADIVDSVRMNKIFSQYTPSIVFHAAAYKHVPIMEHYPREAINVNVKGTKTIADLANKYKVEKFVMVSTDKAVNPTNVMGATKRIAEMYIQSLSQKSDTQYVTTRFGNVLGSNGSVVPRFKKQIAKGGPITVTHPDITRYFMTIPEASQLVLEAGTMGNGGEIFLFDMGEPVKILDLAKRIIRLSGLRPEEDITIKFSGLRPGEKLTEELLSNKENSISTHHPKLTKAKVDEFPFEKIDKYITDLISIIDRHDDMTLVAKMKVIVPEYISNNSIYNSLDIKIA